MVDSRIPTCGRCQKIVDLRILACRRCQVLDLRIIATNNLSFRVCSQSLWPSRATHKTVGLAGTGITPSCHTVTEEEARRQAWTRNNDDHSEFWFKGITFSKTKTREQDFSVRGRLTSSATQLNSSHRPHSSLPSSYSSLM